MELENSSRRFKLLSNEHRLQVLKLLWAEEKNVSRIAQELQLEQSLLSHHLSLLRQEGLVSCTRKGKEILYTVSSRVRGENPGSFKLGCCDISFDENLPEHQN